MDKLKKYQDILENFLTEEAAVPFANSSIEKQVLVDRKNNHFQLLDIGWENTDFTYDVVLHFDIKPDGKIWVQQNWTELQIADELMKRGVSRSDIVLGFQHPAARQFSGFSMA